MSTPDLQRLLTEARAARDRARGVLESLARSGIAEDDPLRRATGRSSRDRAATATRQILETLERSIAELERRATPRPEVIAATREAARAPATLG